MCIARSSFYVLYLFFLFSNKFVSNNFITIFVFEVLFVDYKLSRRMNNKPFTFGVATSGSNFTDREQETKRLLSNFQYGVNTILVSPRRWGKTSLVRKVGVLAQSEKLKIVYLDIFSCRNEFEFYQAFASAVLRQTASEVDKWLEYAKQFLSRLSPKLSFGTDPMSDFSLSFDFVPELKDVDELLDLPERIAEKQGCRIVVCIDEFQQIAEFQYSKNFQKKLRSIWQLQKSVSYCLFGSKKHLMNELFEKKSYPFYKFGDVIYLPKIATEYWLPYICGRFEATGKKISEAIALQICQAVENHSSYVQQLSWMTWINTEGEVTKEGFELALRELVEQNSLLFEKQTENLSSYQLNFLKAIVSGVHQGFSTKKVLQEYNLGTSANISIVKRALIKKELIDIENGSYVIPDPVLALWLRKRM